MPIGLAAHPGAEHDRVALGELIEEPGKPEPGGLDRVAGRGRGVGEIFGGGGQGVFGAPRQRAAAPAIGRADRVERGVQRVFVDRGAQSVGGGVFEEVRFIDDHRVGFGEVREVGVVGSLQARLSGGFEVADQPGVIDDGEVRRGGVVEGAGQEAAAHRHVLRAVVEAGGAVGREPRPVVVELAREAQLLTVAAAVGQLRPDGGAGQQQPLADFERRLAPGRRAARQRGVQRAAAEVVAPPFEHRRAQGRAEARLRVVEHAAQQREIVFGKLRL